MGFFDALKRVLTHETHPQVTDETRKGIRDAWGLDDEEAATEVDTDSGAGAEGAGPPRSIGQAATSEYDRKQWEKKLRTILDELPGSRGHWQDLMAEAHALGLATDWIAERQRNAFSFLVRRAVADRVISEDDHRTLDLARKLIGLTEAEAEQTLHSIMAEASAFFGAPVREEA
jgi:hypothetical protein